MLIFYVTITFFSPQIDNKTSEKTTTTNNTKQRTNKRNSKNKKDA